MKLKRIVLILAVVAAAFTLSSCEELLKMLLADSGITIEEQITSFEATLNSTNRTAILDHIHPDMVNRQQLADLQVWEAGPLSSVYTDFTFGIPSVDAYDVATCTYSAGNGTGTIVFTMKLDGADYKILKLELSIDGVTGDPYILERYQTKS